MRLVLELVVAESSLPQVELVSDIAVEDSELNPEVLELNLGERAKNPEGSEMNLEVEVLFAVEELKAVSLQDLGWELKNLEAEGVILGDSDSSHRARWNSFWGRLEFVW